MCERCGLMDYPVADVWRPCWQPNPTDRRTAIPLRPIPGEEAFEPDRVLAIVRAQLKRAEKAVTRLTAENEHLKARRTEIPDFPGI